MYVYESPDTANIILAALMGLSPSADNYLRFLRHPGEHLGATGDHLALV